MPKNKRVERNVNGDSASIRVSVKDTSDQFVMFTDGKCDCGFKAEAECNDAGLVRHVDSKRHKDGMEKLTEQSRVPKPMSQSKLWKMFTKKADKTSEASEQDQEQVPDVVMQEPRQAAGPAKLVQSLGKELVFLDSKNDIHRLDSTNIIDIKLCRGVIPSVLHDVVPPQAKTLLRYIPPCALISTQKQFKVDEDGVHDVRCPGLLWDSMDGECNNYCKLLEDDRHLKQIIETGNGEAVWSRDSDMHFQGLFEKVKRKHAQKETLRLKGITLGRKLLNQVNRIDIFQRIFTQIALGNARGVERIFRTCHKNGKSPEWLRHKVEEFVSGFYSPAGECG